MTPSEIILRKNLVASGLSSSEWSQAAAGLRDRAFFSSRVESLRFLESRRVRIAVLLAASWAGMPRDFPGDLSFAFSKLPDGRPIPSLVSKRDATSAVYSLVHRVKTRHDPDALPPVSVQTSAATAAVRTAVQRILAR